MREHVDVTSEKNEGSQRAADNLFLEFEKMILSGSLKDGDPLPPEREIVEKFGVSRTVVREAILALSNKGLVVARPRFRPVVRKPNFDTAIETIENVVHRLLDQHNGVRNLFDTRIMIEASLVRQAAAQATRSDLEALSQALEHNAAAIEDSEKFYQTDTAFHGVLYQIPRNPLLPSIHKAYTTWLAPYWSKMPRLPARNRENYQAHMAIYEAILMRGPDEAEAALREHLANAWDQVRKTFENEWQGE